MSPLLLSESMEKVSVSITSEHLKRIESRADEDGTGRSAALRAILDDEVRRRV